jgi:hypothetical protein
LKGHEVGDGLVALIRVVDRLETDILLVLEQAVELRVLPVKGELREEEVDILAE